MVVATLADLAEGMDGAVRDALKLLQRQMKAGLTAGPSLGMYEVGFVAPRDCKGPRSTVPSSHEL